ncbi:4-(cytidine 5'-diphospho)-2-C-methyl-D-erythritol kinase [Thermomonas sp.]|uniref:4-(cytidine 5'-diphospho)-2-C-methyl-D-erythritol kinase n=1 Tax=Thermomonas sp. TaxID=1971895 RepID=UPI002631C985|nr:4-(cytidine 5'-diphospho)-2-C-methyl-D-erythritol kinase [Thermomonas sp.]
MSFFAEQDGWHAFPAPAKLNLFLQITGRRADGYHMLQTVFRLLDWGDTVYLRPRTDAQIVRVGAGAEGVSEADDLLVRAAKLLQAAAGCGKGAEIGIKKRIPMGGGFGGGSSDAATALVALNALWGLELSEDTLAQLGLNLGADVPVFVRGHSAWAEGVGERLSAIALPEAWYVLASPGVHAATAELFRAQDLTRDAEPTTIAGFLSGEVLGNAFEPVLRRLEPAVDAMFQTLSSIGSPRLTGSGSGCFVEFANRRSAEQALAVLPAGIHAWLARGTERSPLLDAVDRFSAGASPSG